MLDFIFSFLGILGQYYLSRKYPNVYKVNIIFLLGNILAIIYFIINYNLFIIIQYCVFTFYCIKGIINNKTNKKMYVLLQPYSYNPNESYKRACKITNKYIKKGYYIFSPILHTHYFAKSYQFEESIYYEWDFEIYGRFQNVIYLFTHDWEQSTGCKKEMEWIKNYKFKYEILEDDE